MVRSMAPWQIGSRLRQIRERAGHSQKRVAKLLQVSPATYLKIEYGRRPLEPREAEIFIAEYRVDPLWLVFGLSEESRRLVDFVEPLKPEQRAAADQLFRSS